MLASQQADALDFASLSRTEIKRLLKKYQLAPTTQNTLLKRRKPREVSYEFKSTLESILKSGLLYNPDKEYLETKPCSVKTKLPLTFLVRAKEDLSGPQKKPFLENHSGLRGINV